MSSGVLCRRSYSATRGAQRQLKGNVPADLNPFEFSKSVSNAFAKALQLLIAPMASSGQPATGYKSIFVQGVCL